MDAEQSEHHCKMITLRWDQKLKTYFVPRKRFKCTGKAHVSGTIFECDLCRSCSHTIKKGRDRQTRDYYSPSRSRSISRSASPPDDGAHRPSRRSASPRRNGRSPLDKRGRGSDMRSLSHQGDDPIPRDRRDLRADRRSPVAREDDRTLSRSRPRSLSRSYSPR